MDTWNVSQDSCQTFPDRSNPCFLPASGRTPPGSVRSLHSRADERVDLDLGPEPQGPVDAPHREVLAVVCREDQPRPTRTGFVEVRELQVVGEPPPSPLPRDAVDPVSIREGSSRTRRSLLATYASPDEATR